MIIKILEISKSTINFLQFTSPLPLFGGSADFNRQLEKKVKQNEI